MRSLLLAGLATAALVPFGLSVQGKTLAVGDKIPESKFNDVIWSWDGAESLSDYLGEPVLVDFWGKN